MRFSYRAVLSFIFTLSILTTCDLETGTLSSEIGLIADLTVQTGPFHSEAGTSIICSEALPADRIPKAANMQLNSSPENDSTLKELFGTDAGCYAISRGNTLSCDYAPDSLNLVQNDLIIELNNSRTGLFNFSFNFLITGALPESGVFHIEIINDYDETLGYINLQPDSRGIITAIGQLDIENRNEILILTLTNDYSENSNRYEEIRSSLVIREILISSSQENLH